jgi:hypothetical protein
MQKKKRERDLPKMEIFCMRINHRVETPVLMASGSKYSEGKNSFICKGLKQIRSQQKWTKDREAFLWKGKSKR